MRVAAAGIAKKYLLEKLGLQITGFVSAVGDIRMRTTDLATIPDNPFSARTRMRWRRSQHLSIA